MKRGGKLLALCAAMVILLAGYLVLRELTAEPEEGAGEVIVSLEPDDITSLAWTYNSVSSEESDGETESETVELSHSDGQWEWSEDSAFPLSQTDVEDMAAQVLEITCDTMISSPAEMSEYGLDEPELEIDIGLSDGTTVSLTIGDENEITGESYLMLDGDESRVYTVTSELRDTFSVGLYDIIEMEELPDFGDVTQLYIDQPDGELELLYIEDSAELYYNDTYHWFVDYGGEYMAVTDSNASSLYGNVTDLYWLRCVDYDASDAGTLAAYGLAVPETRVELTYLPADSGDEEEESASEDPQTFTLLIGDDCDDGTYAMVEGSTMVYVISADTADSLRYATYTSLKPSLVCDMEWDTVESLEIEMDEEIWTVDFSTREEETTNDDGEVETVTEDVYTWGDTELDAEDFENILDAINSLSITASATGDTGDEMLRVTFRRNTEYFQELTLVISAYSADECCVSFNGTSRMLVERSSVTSLVDSIAELFETAG